MNNSLINELTHHGILGQKWGVRRYQNEDGTYTSAGKIRYNSSKHLNRNLRAANKLDRDAEDLRKHGYLKEAEAVQKVADENREKGKLKQEKQINKKSARQANNPKMMSDQELDSKLNRLRKESEYRRLKENENTGRKFVSNYKKAATITASAALAAWSVKKGKELISKYKDIIFN